MSQKYNIKQINQWYNDLKMKVLKSFEFKIFLTSKGFFKTINEVLKIAQLIIFPNFKLNKLGRFKWKNLQMIIMVSLYKKFHCKQ